MTDNTAEPRLTPGAVAAALPLVAALATALLFGVASMRLRERTLADQTTRRRIMEALHAVPGQTAGRLGDGLALHPNTVRYHLWVMTKASRVIVRRAKGRSHYFLAGTGAPASDAPAMLLHAGPARELYDAVASNPGAQVRDICTLTRTHRTTVHYHVRTLHDAGLLIVQRDGKKIRLFTRPAPA